MAFEALRKKYLPNVDPDNTIAYAGYGQAVSMGEILRRCGEDLTRANVLKHASTLAGYPLAVLPRRHQFQLHARRLLSDEDTPHLGVRRQRMADFGAARYGVAPFHRRTPDSPWPEISQTQHLNKYSRQNKEKKEEKTEFSQKKKPKKKNQTAGHCCLRTRTLSGAW